MTTIFRLVVLAVLLSPAPAFAAPEEGGLLSIDTGLMVWTVLIFLIVLGVLYKAAFPALLGAVEAREERIREMLASAERDRAEAAALLEKQKAEMEELRSRVQEMVAEGRTAGERVREDIIAEARREQQELLERTRRDIRHELEAATAELRAEVVDIAIAAASKIVEENLDQPSNRRLVQEYLESISLADERAARV